MNISLKALYLAARLVKNPNTKTAATAVLKAAKQRRVTHQTALSIMMKYDDAHKPSPPESSDDASSDDASSSDDKSSDPDDSDTPEQFWQRSLSNMAGYAIALQAQWTRDFGDDWEKFEVPSDLVTLAKQAANAWAEVAAKLSKSTTSSAVTAAAERAEARAKAKAKVTT